jgi:hypothetical protein
MAISLQVSPPKFFIHFFFPPFTCSCLTDPIFLNIITLITFVE